MHQERHKAIYHRIFPGTLLADDVMSTRCEMAIDQSYAKNQIFKL